MPKSPLTFQEIIMTLEHFWASRGFIIWQPHHTEVGAGTMNPGTILRVLGPEPWNIAYVEPSIRPDDGRYGENPNRLQQHYQYQVILKPDPGNPQELYLASLEALGINPREHDIRFVEDNWESPALGAWGLGWEVWLDGQEITQFTYFQQSGGASLDPVAVELTYGLERIAIALQRVTNFRDLIWTRDPATGRALTYGDIYLQNEQEQSKYYFEIADVERLRQMYTMYGAEAEANLAAGLVMPAHDYILKMSHTFNVLDARGAIGVTERQAAFGRMRGLARKTSEAYLEQRKQLEYPLLKETADDGRPTAETPRPSSIVNGPSSLVLEIGTEELPAADLDGALAQLRELAPKFLADARLTYGDLQVLGTPRRLAVLVKDLAPAQPDRELVVKGPPAARAFDANGAPTPAAEGFARKNNVPVAALERRTIDNGEYVVAVVKETGRPAYDVLLEGLPKLAAAVKFEKTMRWRAGDPTAFSRPVRWLVALLGPDVIPFKYAGLTAGYMSRGLRPLGSPPVIFRSAEDYLPALAKAKIEVDPGKRRALILKQVRQLAKAAGGVIADEGVLGEVTNLVERPTALLGTFSEEALALPREVLIAVMKKHQRYFPVETADGQLLPCFVAVRNGDTKHLDLVREGNEHVIRARFADANFFVREDRQTALAEFRPKLSTLTFQAKLGSMLDKSERIEALTVQLAPALGLAEAETATARRAAHLCKADLATQMVVEMTSLQGIMGYEYALASGEPREVAVAIREHYGLPATKPGIVVGIADRLDSLAGLFAAGLAPSGSADPFGLRRAALSANQILMDNALDFDLRAALTAALEQLPAHLLTDRAKLLGDLQAFLAGRLRGQLLEQGFKYDVVDAVLAEQAHNPARARAAIAQLSAWVGRAEWPQILPAYARCVRITRDQAEQFPVEGARLGEPAEQALDAASRDLAPAASIDAFLNQVVPLIPAITEFFDKVLVMAEDPAVRASRLGLLQRIARLSAGLADLSKLEGF